MKIKMRIRFPESWSGTTPDNSRYVEFSVGKNRKGIYKNYIYFHPTSSWCWFSLNKYGPENIIKTSSQNLRTVLKFNKKLDDLNSEFSNLFIF